MSNRAREAVKKSSISQSNLVRACIGAVETLERRQLFSAALEAGVWQIRGDATGDVIVVEAVPGDATSLRAVINGAVAGTVTAADVASIDLDAGAGDDRVTLRLEAANSSATLRASAAAIQVRGGDGDDRLFGSSLGETFYGGAGNDRIDGGGGDDVIYGDDGNDNLSGGDGNDDLFAGAGNDVVAGGWGDDDLHGDIGKDRLSGGHDDDNLQGDKGADKLFGGKGVDNLDGGKGTDRVYAENGVDHVGPVGGPTPGVKAGRDRLSVDDTHESTLRQTTDAELKQWLVDAAVKQWSWAFGKATNPWIYYWGRGGEVAIKAGVLNDVTNGGVSPTPAPPASPPPPQASPTTNGNVPDASSTNTQVAGVDEADLVETDGHYIYTLQNGQLVITDADPAASMSVVHRDDIDGSAIGIYLSGDRLTMLTGSLYYWAQPATGGIAISSLMPITPAQDPFVTVTVFDVSNPASPSVVETTKLDGSYGESRLIGDQLYVVMRNDAWIPEPEKIPNPDPAPVDPDPQDPPTNVVVDDPTAGSPGGVSSISKIAPPFWGGGGYSDTIYESEAAYRARLEAMTLADLLPGYTSTADGKTTDGPLVSAPNAYVRDLGDNEIGQNLTTVTLLDVGDTNGGPTATSTVAGYGGTVYASADALYLAGTTWSDDGEETRLFKFGLEADAVTLQATGSVDGSVLDQFGMDEYADTFRIATNNWSGDGPTNHLFVLEQVGDQLETIGSIKNIAKGEQLQAARFDGPRAYIVTFLQVDPLFTVDLSDARSPKIAGELKIPGYSSYLQPIGEGLLLGIGRDIDSDGVDDNGLLLSLFDVSDFAHPTRIAKTTIADGYSEAEYDPHAFSYFAEQNILAVPVGSYGDGEYTQSLAVFEVDVAGKQFKSLGNVDPGSEVRRSLRINDVLFAVGDEHIQAVELLHPDVIIKTLKTSE
ncbi:beta-propeller domain-containing protein [Humisphaera borealis]|uniref:Beta-propeller domain-containing protein n=1 Tax=Humisphaera borealis TaxID=2807512 RepID=A0A7M2WQQ8_9BACT|nr:beta-propeller domain-containing protein [Humisphaera borealis]QOV87574.1 beta-propeller domain-containing protein [Humisphaera borealis]